MLWAHLDAARRGGGSPSSRRCGGTATSAALSSNLDENNLDGTIPTEFGLMTAVNTM